MKVRGGEFSTGTMGNFQPELTIHPRVKGLPPASRLSCRSALRCSIEERYSITFTVTGLELTLPLPRFWRGGMERATVIEYSPGALRS